MAINRFSALEQLNNRPVVKEEERKGRDSEIFGINVFDREKMRQYLSREAYMAVVDAIDNGIVIERRLADQIASGMKAWALEKGATHYTHWFHPLNGATAEKHDAFLHKNPDGSVIESFDGGLLVQQEPDASSFPNGGIRNTFEARGYSAWDPTSPAFINNHTLCIPTIFVSYTGEALDYKTPLLNALSAVDKAAVDICQFFDKNVSKVISTLGWEQEYFLVDEALYNARPDLVLCDRTLMGHESSKGQQLDDHYFGAIPDRVTAYMKDFELECYKLGIPVKTRHNEVAPNQYECAPIFEEANLAVDHNQLLMSTMKRVSHKHKFVVLMHEKPYKGINGSGKHNNWSLMTNTGVNLLSPGKNPKSNIQFLVFLVCTVKAVYDHADLFRAAIVSAGNEHRLGADEAPPVVMSVFLGDYLTSVLDELVEKVSENKMSPNEKTELKLNIGKIPEIMMDNTDRNRTSPFAFTGNRFEFRAVGSSANCATAMTILNTAVSKILIDFKIQAEQLIEDGVKKDEAIFQILKKYIIKSRSIRFEGNGYGKEWIDESKRRGLTNVKGCVEALKAYVSDETIKLFEDINVLSERELTARYEIQNEIYIKKLQIEARVIGDLAINHIIPTAISYQNILILNVKGLKDVMDVETFKESSQVQLESITKISRHITAIRRNVSEMVAHRKTANRMSDIIEKAHLYSEDIKPYIEKIRIDIDKLEMIVDDEMWPLPKYRELLFVK
jgi:glutamine synthetase